MKNPSRREALAAMGAATMSAWLPAWAQPNSALQGWPLNAPKRTGIHDVAPASDRGVWFTAQASGHLGYFDPATAKAELIALGMARARTA
jgi:virginiamycin B lyase